MGDNAIEEGNDILGKFNPGLGAQSFDIGGSAKLIPKGSDLVATIMFEINDPVERHQFLMQIGKPKQSKGSNDTENLRLPAKTFVDKETNELYVADGYGNHRVIVYDADTGKYKRHWWAYGNRPDDSTKWTYDANNPNKQLNTPHGIAVIIHVQRRAVFADQRAQAFLA